MKKMQASTFRGGLPPTGEADQTGKADPLRFNGNEKSFTAFHL